MMSANTLRQKMPDFIKNDTGFLVYPTEDINLAHLADKLLVSRQLNGKTTKYSAELNTLNSELSKVKTELNNFKKTFNGSKSNTTYKNWKNKPKKDIVCYFCKKPYHRYQDCRNLKREQEAGKLLDWKPNFPMKQDSKPQVNNVNAEKSGRVTDIVVCDL